MPRLAFHLLHLLAVSWIADAATITTSSTSATREAFPSTCSPACGISLPSGRLLMWATFTPTSTVVAATVRVIVNRNTNSTTTTTIFNTLPAGVEAPPTNSDGTRVATVTSFAVTGGVTTVAYPSRWADYDSIVAWSGQLYTKSTCTSEPGAEITLPPHPPIPQTELFTNGTTATPDPEDPNGYFYSPYYERYFPRVQTYADELDEQALTSCAYSIASPPRALSGIRFLTETETSTDSSLPSSSPAPAPSSPEIPPASSTPESPPPSSSPPPPSETPPPTAIPVVTPSSSAPPPPPPQSSGQAPNPSPSNPPTNNPPTNPPTNNPPNTPPENNPNTPPNNNPSIPPNNTPPNTNPPNNTPPETNPNNPPAPNNPSNPSNPPENNPNNPPAASNPPSNPSNPPQNNPNNPPSPTNAPNPPQNPPPPPVIIVGTAPVTALPNSGPGNPGTTFIVGTQTLTPGGTITLSGTTVALNPSVPVVVVNGESSSISVQTPAAEETTLGVGAESSRLGGSGVATGTGGVGVPPSLSSTSTGAPSEFTGAAARLGMGMSGGVLGLFAGLVGVVGVM